VIREADAVWTDGTYAGRGSVSVTSGVLNRTRYVFGIAETGGATSPGELLAAAIASSVSATVARKMTDLGAHPATIRTYAKVALSNLDENWKISSVHLDIWAQARETESSRFTEAVEFARRECPIASELNLDVSCTTTLIPLGTQVAV
jgi:osmotically inducible protein OsmC